MKRYSALFASLFALLAVVGMTMAPVAVRADQNAAELDGLFERLKSSTDYRQAAPVERKIWQIWSTHGTREVNEAMAYGIAAMNAGALHLSVRSFNRVIRLAPDFAEGWNKRATVYFMMGRFEESVEDIRRTLVLEPRHFGALSGMGLIYDQLDNRTAAARVWEKALDIHPKMPGIRDRVEKIRRAAKGEPI